jgi:hypothetical protein
MAPNPKPPPTRLDGKPAKKSGRPPKLTPELIEQIAKIVRTGTYLDTASVYCGVSKAAFHDWMRKGHEQKRGRYRDFLDAMHQAQAEADVLDHARLMKAGDKDWRSIVEHLRLRNPDRYSKRTELSGPGGKPVGVTAAVEASLLDTFKKLLADDGGDDGKPS